MVWTSLPMSRQSGNLDSGKCELPSESGGVPPPCKGGRPAPALALGHLFREDAPHIPTHGDGNDIVIPTWPSWRRLAEVGRDAKDQRHRCCRRHAAMMRTNLGEGGSGAGGPIAMLRPALVWASRRGRAAIACWRHCRRQTSACSPRTSPKPAWTAARCSWSPGSRSGACIFRMTA
jgi:hypothetical protein